LKRRLRLLAKIELGIQTVSAIHRTESGKYFEGLAINILGGLGFSNIIKVNGDEPYDLIGKKDGQRCFIEVKGRKSKRKVDDVWFLIQYEKLWNLIEVAEKGRVFFLFLTLSDHKLIHYDDLDADYFKHHRLRLTVKRGGSLEREILRHKMLATNKGGVNFG